MQKDLGVAHDVIKTNHYTCGIEEAEGRRQTLSKRLIDLGPTFEETSIRYCVKDQHSLEFRLAALVDEFTQIAEQLFALRPA